MSVTRAKTPDEIIRHHVYKATGAVYSRDPVNIERGLRRLKRLLKSGDPIVTAAIEQRLGVPTLQQRLREARTHEKPYVRKAAGQFINLLMECRRKSAHHLGK